MKVNGKEAKKAVEVIDLTADSDEEIEEGNFEEIIEDGEDDGNEFHEDDDDEEEEEEEEGHHRMEVATKGKAKMSLLPSKDEQLALRETENLMRTNLLKIQIDEMLSEVRVASKIKSFEKVYKDILQLLPSIPSMEEVNESFLLQLNLSSFFSLAKKHSKPVKLSFLPPKNILKVGSYENDTLTAPYLNLDLAILMPSECFEDKDILNHIYFDKRKLYLAVLINALKNSDLVKKENYLLQVGLFKGDERKPILVISSEDKKLSIQLFLTV